MAVVGILSLIIVGGLPAAAERPAPPPVQPTKSAKAGIGVFSVGQTVTSISGGVTAAELAQALVGDGIQISNVSFTGSPRQAGLFTGMSAAGIEQGAVLSSGAVNTEAGYTSSILGPNNQGSLSGDFLGAGDTDLNVITAPEATQDAAVLEFDFVPTGPGITFNYVFGSEEYPEWVNAGYKDGFGFFVNGENCATVDSGDGSRVPVSIDTINSEQLSQFYRPNTTGVFDTQMDGMTTVLTCFAEVDQNQTNHIKLAIADAGDTNYDSSVLIESGSISVNFAPDPDDLDLNTPVDEPVAAALTATDPEDDPIGFTVATQPQHGQLSGTAPDLTYTPDPGFLGTDSFTYIANDGHIDSAPATVTITVVPVATDDDYNTPYNTPLVVELPGLLANDHGESITPEIVDQPAHGTFDLSSDGSFTYTPDQGFTGQDSLTYKLLGGGVESKTATVTITVGRQDLAAVGDEFETAAEVPLTVDAPGVLGNDSGLELAAALASGPADGTVDLAADGSFVYTPADGFSGTDTFTYTITDAGSSEPVSSEPATVTITVTPVGIDDAYSVSYRTALTVPAPGILSNDIGRHLMATVLTQPAHGVLDWAADGSFVYTPEPGYSGLDTFTYQPSDTAEPAEDAQSPSLKAFAAEAVAPAAVTVTLTIDPAQITTVADEYTTDFQTQLRVEAPGVSANDTGIALSTTLSTEPEHGRVELAADGSFVYTPDQGFTGADTFAYVAGDGFVSSDSTLVTITVGPAPVVPRSEPTEIPAPEPTATPIPEPLATEPEASPAVVLPDTGAAVSPWQLIMVGGLLVGGAAGIVLGVRRRRS